MVQDPASHIFMAVWDSAKKRHINWWLSWILSQAKWFPGLDSFKEAQSKNVVVGFLCGVVLLWAANPSLDKKMTISQKAQICHGVQVSCGFQMSHRFQSTWRTFLAKSKQGPCPIKVLLTQNLFIQPEIGKTAAHRKRFFLSQQPQSESDSYCTCQEGLQDHHRITECVGLEGS